MLFKFFILSILFNILCASSPGSRGGADKNNQIKPNSRDDKINQPSTSSSYTSKYDFGSEPQRTPLDLSTKNRQTDQYAPSTSGGKKKSFDCSQCGKSYTAVGSLNRHVNYDHKGKKEICVECGKSFNSQSAMSYHKQSNHQGITFDCTKCNRKFTKKQSLEDHDRVEHQENGELFNCDKCPYQTKQRTTFINHRRKNHPGSNSNFY